MQANLNSKSEKNIASLIINWYLPYWPLFLILIVVGIGTAWVYLHLWAVPVYESNATVMVKDEKKGVDESGSMEALQIYPTKNIAENEIEVLHSRKLIEQVIEQLLLYAPIHEGADFSQWKFNETSAYVSSPVSIVVKNPDELTETGDTDIALSVNYYTPKERQLVNNGYNDKVKEVVIENKKYPLRVWCNTRWGELKFIPNEKQTTAPVGPLLFSLNRPKDISPGILLNLVVSSPNKLSTTIDLTLRDEIPQRGEDILNKLLIAYNRQSILEKQGMAANTLEFIEVRLEKVEKELDSIESVVQTFRTDKGVVDLGEQGKMYLQNVGDNDRKIADLSMQMAALDEMEEYVNSRSNKGDLVPATLGIADAVLIDLMQKLTTKKVEYETLLKTTAENNPYAIGVQKEIEQLRPLVLEKLKNYRLSMDAGRRNLTSISNGYNSELRTIPQKERELMTISREQAIKKGIYSYLLEKREQTALASSSANSDSKIVDMAGTSAVPVSPKKMMVYCGALAVFGGLGIGIVSLKEMMNKKILFRSEIESLTNVPVIAEISVNRDKESLLKSSSKVSIVAEQFRHLRASIGLFGRKKEINIKRILCTSSIPGEGKTYVSTNLATSLALAGNKVVLVDLDIRKPRTSAIMGIDQHAGVAEFLDGSKTPEEIIMTTELKSLSVVSAGRGEENSRELILSGRLDILIAYLSDNFDYVVLDASPIDPVSDSYTFSEFCDITLFVIRHNRTPKTMVQILDNNNKFKALKNPRIVFNGIRSRGILKGMYGYSYGYGYENVYRDRENKRSKLQKIFHFSSKKDKKIRV
ncbi:MULTISPECIES: GumC family protein [Niastella]|uniref:non-specific protein-tyrosine kinase n=1 Tax=Niastella soli TaxID=2821487 RepID=A0ABS3YSH0_9BACT|nr:polysaccharide biosynthesis tyrosine autokinase [Niastella soli]MBO9200517.1 polysaccharide biosynthesis tyrosine autokinase [Niastella soli]